MKKRILFAVLFVQIAGMGFSQTVEIGMGLCETSRYSCGPSLSVAYNQHLLSWLDATATVSSMSTVNRISRGGAQYDDIFRMQSMTTGQIGVVVHYLAWQCLDMRLALTGGKAYVVYNWEPLHGDLLPIMHTYKDYPLCYSYNVQCRWLLTPKLGVGAYYGYGGFHNMNLHYSNYGISLSFIL